MGNVALGLNNLSNIKFGNNQVSSVYLGTNLVWSSYTYILDLYGPAYHAYSLRKLSSTYTGKAIRVRRTTSTPLTTTVDVAFDSNNRISLESVCSFVSGSPTTPGIKLGDFAAAVASGYNSNPDGININQDIFVVTWFDQSGNAKNPTQASTPLQPKIVSSGVLEAIDGSAGVRFTSASSQLLNVADTSTSYTNMSCYALGNSISATVNTSIYGQGISGTNARLFLPSTTNIAYNTASTFPISGITANVDRLYEIVCGASTTSAYSNGTISSVASVASVSATNVYIRIGSNGSPATYMNGHIKEVIAFIGTANRTNIETNINQYYTVW